MKNFTIVFFLVACEIQDEVNLRLVAVVQVINGDFLSLSHQEEISMFLLLHQSRFNIFHHSVLTLLRLPLLEMKFNVHTAACIKNLTYTLG